MRHFSYLITGELNEWCRLAYWELSHRVGPAYPVQNTSINIFWTDMQADGLSLETLAHHSTSPPDSVHKNRNKIGLGESSRRGHHRTTSYYPVVCFFFLFFFFSRFEILIMSYVFFRFCGAFCSELINDQFFDHPFPRPRTFFEFFKYYSLYAP